VNENGRHELQNLRIFKLGTFADSVGEVHTWDDIHFDQMIAHFHLLRDAGIFPDVPFRADHTLSVKDVVGYITGVYRDPEDPNFLDCAFEFVDPHAYQQWIDGKFRARSLEVGMYETNEGATFWPVVMGCAFVDIGAVEGLYAKQRSVASFSQVITDDKETPVGTENTQGQGTAPLHPYANMPTGQVQPGIVPQVSAPAQQTSQHGLGPAGPGGVNDKTPTGATLGQAPGSVPPGGGAANMNMGKHKHLHVHRGMKHAQLPQLGHTESPTGAYSPAAGDVIHSHDHPHPDGNMNTDLQMHTHEHSYDDKSDEWTLTPPDEAMPFGQSNPYGLLGADVVRAGAMAPGQPHSAAPQPQQTAEPQHGQPLTFMAGGRPTNDYAGVQRHITALETFRAETIDMGRRNFVTNMATSNRIAATQIDAMQALVLTMSDEQFAAFRATYEAAPSAPLFSAYGQQGDSNSPRSPQPAPMTSQGAANEPSEIEILEETILNHKRAGMNDEQIAKTKSFARLQTLKKPAAAGGWPTA